MLVHIYAYIGICSKVQTDHDVNLSSILAQFFKQGCTATTRHEVKRQKKKTNIKSRQESCLERTYQVS